MKRDKPDFGFEIAMTFYAAFIVAVLLLYRYL